MEFTQEELQNLVNQSRIPRDERWRLLALVNTHPEIAQRATRTAAPRDVVAALQGYLSLPAGVGAQDALAAAIGGLSEDFKAGLRGLSEDYKAGWQGLREEIKADRQFLHAAVAERLSQTRAASKIKLREVEELTKSVNCRISWEFGDPPLEELLGPAPKEEFWDQDSPEPEQRERCAAQLKSYFPKTRRGPSAFELIDAKGQTVKMTCEGVSYPVAGQNDELIIMRRYHNDPQHGAIMGVELKKEMTWGAVRQASAEFLLFAARSWYPYCQVATDLEKGGIALYMSGEVGGERIITGRVFSDMPSFWQFYSSLLENTPRDLAADADELFPQELPSPKRMKFYLQKPPGDGDAAPCVHAALHTIAGIFNNWGDVANLGDLQGFPELGTHGAMPSCIT